MKETDLYPPIKAFLEGQGYEVKGEVAGADVVGIRAGDEAPVIVELKTAFSLTLIHQGIDRQKSSDWVYLAIPRGTGRPWRAALKRHITLCRRLGLGLLSVRADGTVEAHLDPGPYKPRQSPQRRTRLLREFTRREGDPNLGGMNKGPVMTAYRQDAVKLAQHLAQHGPAKGAAVAAATGVPRATEMMRADHYGWFERVDRGVYALTPKGHQATSL